MTRAIIALAIASLSFAAFAGPPGPPGSVDVNVTNPILPVRSVYEPALVPYVHDLAPVCNFLNSCEVDFPAVPAGKRLRITSVRLMFTGTNVESVFVVRETGVIFPTVAFPVAPFNGAYFGYLLSGSFDVDLIYEAGEQPTLELGNTSTIVTSSVNRFGVTGYLVDVAP